MPKHEPIKILLVEDNEGDVMLTKLAFEKADIPVDIIVTQNGIEAMEYLRREGKFTNALTPDIVLLDLNMPKMSGKEVLKEIKEDPELKVIPVIILTSSEAHMDVLNSYRYYANAYIIKPVTVESFIDVAQTIEDFWVKINKLPSLV
ncbi:MAG: response regulator [Alphaproteobacteria bacterium]|nr:response regulator [Alphaproteobacteria bacterium]